MRSTGPNNRGFDLLRLHLKLKDTVSRVLEFVNCTQVYLSAPSSQTDLRRHHQLLEVLNSDKEQWEHYVKQAVGVDAWLLREQGVSVEREFEGDLGRVTEVLAGAQGKLMAVVKRYSAEITPFVWEIFADLRQAFYEQFFQCARPIKPDPQLQETIRMQEEKLGSLQERLQVIERRYSGALEQLEVKEQLIQRLKESSRPATPKDVEAKDKEILRLSRLIDAQEKVIYRKLSFDSTIPRKDPEIDSLRSYRPPSRQSGTPSSRSKDLPDLQAELEDVLAERDQLRELIQSRSPSKKVDSLESEHLEDKRRVNSALSGVRRDLEASRALDTYEKQKQRPVEDQLKLEKERSKAFYRALKAKEREVQASPSPEKLQELRSQLANLQQCLQAKEAAIGQLQADLSSAAARLRDNRPSQRTIWEARVKEAEDRAVHLARELETVRERLENSENSSNLQKLKRKNGEIGEERDRALTQLRELRAEYETARLEVEKTAKSNQQIIKELAKNTEFQSKVALELQAAQAKAANLVENVKKELFHRCQRLHESVNQAQTRLEPLEKQLEGLKRTQERPVQTLAVQAIEENRDLNRKLNSLSSQFEAAKETEKRLKQEISLLKEQIQAQRETHLQAESQLDGQIEELEQEKAELERSRRKEVEEMRKRYESEGELAQVEVQELQIQLQTAISRENCLKTELESTEKRLSQLQTLQNELQTQIRLSSDLQNQLNRLKLKAEASDLQVKSLSSDLALGRNREKELEEEAAAWKAAAEQPAKTPADCEVLISAEMERLEEKISELEGKLQALERENELKDQTIVTLNREIEEENHETSKQVADLKGKIASISSEKDKTVILLENLETELASKRESEQKQASESLKLLQELEELRTNSAQLVTETEILRKALEDEKTNNRNATSGLKEQIRKLKIDITNSELRLEAKEHAFTRLQTELETLRNDHQGSETLSNQLLSSSQDLANERSLRQQQLTESKMLLSTLTQERNQAKDALRSLQSDFEVLKSTASRDKELWEEEKETLQGRLQAVLQTLEELKDTHEATGLKVTSLKQELKGKMTDLAAVSANLRAAETEKETFRKIIETQKGEISRLVEANTRFSQNLRDLTAAESSEDALNTLSAWRDELKRQQIEKSRSEDMLAAATQTLAENELLWRGKLEAMTREKEALESNLEAVKRGNELKTSTQQAQFEAKMADMTAKQASLETELTDLSECCRAQKEEMRDSETELRAVKAELEATRRHMNASSQAVLLQLETAQRQLREKDAELTDLQRISDSKQVSLTQEIDNLTHSLLTLQEESQNLEETLQLEVENLREELKREVERRKTELLEASEEKKRRETALAAGFEERIGLLRGEIAQAGEQFARLSRELTEKEATISEQSHSYEADNRALRSAVKRLEEGQAAWETSARTALDAKEAHVTALTGQLLGLQRDWGSCQEALAAIKVNESRLATAFEESQKRITELEKQLENDEKRGKETLKDLQTAKFALETASTRVSSLQNQVEKQKSDMETQENCSKDAIMRINLQLETTKQAFEQEKSTLMLQFSAKNAEIQTLTNTLAQQQAEINAKDQQISNLEATLSQSYVNKDSEMKGKLDQLRDFEGQIEKLRAELKQSQAEVGEMEGNLESVRQRESRLKSDLEAAEREVIRLNVESSQEKALRIADKADFQAEKTQILIKIDQESEKHSAEIASLQGNLKNASETAEKRISAIQQSLQTAETARIQEKTSLLSTIEDLEGKLEQAKSREEQLGREMAQKADTCLQSEQKLTEMIDNLRLQMQKASEQAENDLFSQSQAISALKSELQQRILSLSSLETEKKTFETSIAALHAEIREKDVEIEQLATRLREKEELKEILEAANAKESALKGQIDQLNSQFTLEKANFSQQTLQFQSEIADLRQKNANLSSLQEEISTLYSNRLEEVNKLTAELVAAQKQQEINVLLTRENEGLKSDLTGKERERSSLTQENEKLREELRAFREVSREEGEDESFTVVPREVEVAAQPEDDQWNAEITDLTDKLASAQAQIDKLERENAHLSSIQEEISILYGNRLEEVNRLTSELVAAKKQQEINVLLSRENEGLKSDLTGKERERSSLTQENEKLKEELKSVKSLWRDSKVALPVELNFEESDEESFTVIQETGDREIELIGPGNEREEQALPVIQRVKSRGSECPFPPSSELATSESSLSQVLSSFDRSLQSGYNRIERRCEELQKRLGRLVCTWEGCQPCLMLRPVKEDEAPSPGAPTPDLEVAEGVCLIVEFREKRWKLVQSGLVYVWKEATGSDSPLLATSMAVLSEKTQTVIESLEKRISELTTELEQRSNSQDYADARSLLQEKGFNFQGQSLTNVISSLLLSTRRSKRLPAPLELPSDSQSSAQSSPYRPALTSPKGESSQVSSDSMALSEPEAASLFQSIERMKHENDDLTRANYDLERQLALYKQRARSAQENTGISTDELTMVVQNLLEALPMQ